MHIYETEGVCCKQIKFDVENGKVKNVCFDKGCPGNLQGIAKLVEGMEVSEVISRLKGVTCGPKGTSCPDQLATALEKINA